MPTENHFWLCTSQQVTHPSEHYRTLPQFIAAAFHLPYIYIYTPKNGTHVQLLVLRHKLSYCLNSLDKRWPEGSQNEEHGKLSCLKAFLELWCYFTSLMLKNMRCRTKRGCLSASDAIDGFYLEKEKQANKKKHSPTWRLQGSETRALEASSVQTSPACSLGAELAEDKGSSIQKRKTGKISSWEQTEKQESYEIKVFGNFWKYTLGNGPRSRREMWVHLATWWLVTPPPDKVGHQVNSCQDRCIFFWGLCNSKHFIHNCTRYKEKHFYQENFQSLLDNFDRLI